MPAFEQAATTGILSAREQEVLDLIARGWSNQGIADGLFCSAKTVERHVTSIMQKLAIPYHPSTNRRVAAALWWAHRSTPISPSGHS